MLYLRSQAQGLGEVFDLQYNDIVDNQTSTRIVWHGQFEVYVDGDRNGLFVLVIYPMALPIISYAIF